VKSYFPSAYHRIRKLKRGTKILVVAVAAALLWFAFCLPDPLFRSPTSYVIEDAEGELLGATIAADGQWRFPYNENVPEKFRQCIISFEDKRFYYHPGVDPLAILRALWQNIRSSQRVSGGSTITMQVIRMSRNRKRNIVQKLIESILAIRLEVTHSKKNILALYASHAPFGSNVVGLDAAAWRYYGRSADKLSWGEMAALAVLPNAPALVHPGKNRGILMSKRDRLLDKLQEEKKIDSITCLLAKLEPLPDEPKPLPQLAPHLLQRFKQEAAPDAGTRAQTTINRNLQTLVTQLVEQHHRVLKGNGINNACALVVEVESGETIAYVGNVNHPETPELQSSVDIITSRRSPGSTLKPLLYAALLTDGLLLPHTLVPDIPTQIGGYTPQNFDRDYDGAVPASRALARSLNVPAVRMLRDYKYPRFYDLLKKTGFTTLNKPADHYGLSLILGGCEVTPWDMAGVYAGMARVLNHTPKNKGKVLGKDFHSPHYMAAADLLDSSLHNETAQTSISGFVDPVSVWYMFQAMEEVMRPGEEGLWKQFGSAQKVAWKTGTSFGFRDAWAVGVTPRYVIVVWTGNGSGEGRPGLIGVQAAAPLLFDILRTLPASGWFEAPRSFYTPVAVCRQSGFRANTDCTAIDTIPTSFNGSHAPLCPYHTIIHLSVDQQYQVTEKCAAPSAMIHKSWFVLPPAMAWYYNRKHFDYQPLPPYQPGCTVWEQRAPMALVYPTPNAKIYVPREITGQKGRAVFTATHQQPGTKIFWHLDDVYIGTTVRTHQMALDPGPGTHFITIVDEAGERITCRFEVLEKEE
jgi:penicillin-binding protein 1C